mmetsp:Transcript_28413/g.51349  ORF Transcript_28413/g.51349 Transcript_28413/m.51349 type:complete len:113 (-) Transcript_28413:7-345(-)
MRPRNQGTVSKMGMARRSIFSCLCLRFCPLSFSSRLELLDLLVLLEEGVAGVVEFVLAPDDGEGGEGGGQGRDGVIVVAILWWSCCGQCIEMRHGEDGISNWIDHKCGKIFG